MSVFKKIGRWAKRRAGEGSTVMGIGMILAPTVAPIIGLPVDTAAGMIAYVLGGVLTGATTRNHTPPGERV